MGQPNFLGFVPVTYWLLIFLFILTSNLLFDRVKLY